MRLDRWMDGQTYTRGYTIIPRQYHMLEYKNDNSVFMSHILCFDNLNTIVDDYKMLRTDNYG